MLILLPELWWPTTLLAAVLLSDAVLSLRPAEFIRACLEGVHFPEEWSWILVTIKVVAAIGLIVGLWVPGIAAAAATGVVVYFVCAAIAHLRARFFGSAFWVNCLGMLALSVGVLLVTLFL